VIEAVEAARQKQPADSQREGLVRPARHAVCCKPAESSANECGHEGWGNRQHCKLDATGESLVRAAMGQMNLSARGYHRC